MVYGGSQFVGVPWETVIKLYRHFQKGPYDYLTNYSEKFIEFLKSGSLLSDDHIDVAFRASIHLYVNELSSQIISQFPTNIDLSTIDFSQEITKFCDNFAPLPRIEECDATYETYLRGHYQNSFTDAFDNIFAKLSGDAREKATTLILDILLSRPAPHDDAVSGLVIAGFGEAELYPSAWRCLIRGILPKRILQISETKDSINSISLDNGASIMPFAQKEMVDSFMTGVDPEFEHHFFSAVGTLPKRVHLAFY